MGVLPGLVILQCLTLCLHGNFSKYVKMAGSSLKGFGQGVQGKVAEPSIISLHAIHKDEGDDLTSGN